MTSRDVVHHVHVAAAGTIRAAISQLAEHVPAVPALVLPSSGSRDDIVASTVREHLREIGIPSTVLAHAHGPLSQGQKPRRTVRIEPPDAAPYEVALPARIADATSILVVTDVNRIVGTSPTVIDLLSHSLRLRDRVRLRATRNTAWLPEINLACPVQFIVAVLQVDEGVIAAGTDDLIAGELMVLAMAEELLPRDVHMTGVWEDKLVQRATELGRWARYPGDLEPAVMIEPGQEALHVPIERILARVGVRTA